jgi:hypothetical protein
MNWKSGIIRIWMVVSVLWIIVMGAFVGPSQWEDFSQSLNCPPIRDNKGPLLFCQFFSRPASEILTSFLFQVLTPPLALFMLGIVAEWVIRGFRIGPEKTS